MQKFYKIKFTEKNKIEEFLEKMNKEKNVIKAWKNKKGEYFSNDTYYSQQWALTKIQAQQAWNIHSGNPSVILGILDSGVDLGDPNSGGPLDPHPDLANNLLNYNKKFGINLLNSDEGPYDEFTHGTHVAGIAGAVTNNGLGIAGIAGGGYSGNGIKLLIIKVSHSSTDLNEENVSSGITQAVNAGVKVINFSLGFTDRINCGDENSPAGYEPYPALKAAVDYAISNNVVLVAAIGNEGWVLSECANGNKITKVYPAAYNNVISVAAIEINDVKASYSNFAVWCSISSPGSNIISTVPRYSDNETPIGYGYKSGTSMASPYVAGVAALIRSYAPESNWEMVRSILKQTVDNIDNANSGYSWIGKIGTGRLNAYKALSLIKNNPAKPTGISLSISNNHPLITWNNNTEADIKGYSVHVKYEFRNGSDPKFWTYTENDYFVTSNQYYDPNWYTAGSDMAYYNVKAVDIINKYSLSSSSVSISGGLGKKSEDVVINKDLPKRYSIDFYPNPFNNQITFDVSLPNSSDISLEIYNVQGQLVNSLTKEDCEAGTHKIKWQAQNFYGSIVPSGVYFIKSSYNNIIISKKVILIK